MLSTVVLTLMLAPAGDPDMHDPPVHAQDAMECPVHYHNLFGVRGIGVLAFDLGEGGDALPEGGFGLAYERTLVPSWLELEVSTNALFAEHGVVLPLDIVLKKPFHVSHRFDPFVGLGAVIAFGVGEERFVAPGAIASGGMYVWASTQWGWSFELDFAAVKEPEDWLLELEFASGPVVRF